MSVFFRKNLKLELLRLRKKFTNTSKGKKDGRRNKNNRR
jgi:hypothetical protein